MAVHARERLPVSDTASKPEPTVIKKYANRRLYNTAKSAYVTLDDLADMVKNEEEFVVRDAKTGDDLTRQVLTQIILDQEGRGGNLLPLNFLRKLIGYYGQNMGGVLPGYLDASLDSFQENQDRLQQQFAAAFGQPIKQFEDITRQNMAMFERALGAFTPFGAGAAKPASSERPTSESDGGDIEDLKKEMDAMRARLDKLAK